MKKQLNEVKRMQVLAGLITEGLYEGEITVNSEDLKSYIDKLLDLANDMEYDEDVIDGLKSLKDGLSDGEISVQDALDVIQKTIDVTGDDIDAIEALGQAVNNDEAIIEKAKEISGIDESQTLNEDITSDIIDFVSKNKEAIAMFSPMVLLTGAWLNNVKSEYNDIKATDPNISTMDAIKKAVGIASEKAVSKSR